MRFSTSVLMLFMLLTNAPADQLRSQPSCHALVGSVQETPKVNRSFMAHLYAACATLVNETHVPTATTARVHRGSRICGVAHRNSRSHLGARILPSGMSLASFNEKDAAAVGRPRLNPPIAWGLGWG
jgi:hypothetical protein